MIAYDIERLHNAALVNKAKRWHKRKFISADQLGLIEKKYPVFIHLNVFIKILLFVFSWILMGGIMGMYSTVFLNSFFGSSGENAMLFMCVLFSLICFVALEVIIRKTDFYRTGIDEALLYMGLSLLLTAIGIVVGNVFDEQNSFFHFAILSLIVFAAAAVRYADAIVSIALVFCAYTVFFILILKLGAIAKIIMPFALMIVSVPLYLYAKKYKEREDLFCWKNCFFIAESISLLVFYAACNYYVIRESSIAYFDMQVNEGEDIPLAFLFYFLTAVVPLLYIFWGLKKKDRTILWIGLLLVVAASLTFKNYFSLGHPEIILTVAGVIMILVAYFSIKYLKIPRNGITFQADPDEDNLLNSNSEALIIAQTFSQQAQTKQSDSPQFGGGEFGGGGAGSDY